MTEHLYFIAPDTTSLDLLDISSGRWVDSIDGIGLPTLRYLALVSALQHGQTYQDYRFDPRIVTLKWGAKQATRQAMWSDHQTWLKNMKPYVTVANIQLVLDDGTTYQLDVRLRAGLPNSSKDLRGPFTQMYTAQFIADNPFWYNPTQSTFTYTVTAFTQITWPVTFPITFGGSVVDQTSTIQTLGTFSAYPKIVLTGPILNPILTNNTTGDIIALTYSISPGEIVTIDLTPGAKTVLNNSGTNLIGKVTPASNLGTWHLAVPPEATSGNNSVHAQFGNGTAASSVVLNWNDQFVGV